MIESGKASTMEEKEHGFMYEVFDGMFVQGVWWMKERAERGRRTELFGWLSTLFEFLFLLFLLQIFSYIILFLLFSQLVEEINHEASKEV